MHSPGRCPDSLRTLPLQTLTLDGNDCLNAETPALESLLDMLNPTWAGRLLRQKRPNPTQRVYCNRDFSGNRAFTLVPWRLTGTLRSQTGNSVPRQSPTSGFMKGF